MRTYNDIVGKYSRKLHEYKILRNDNKQQKSISFYSKNVEVGFIKLVLFELVIVSKAVVVVVVVEVIVVGDVVGVTSIIC